MDLVINPCSDNCWNYWSCYTNIMLPDICCYQLIGFGSIQTDSMCLNRTIKYDLLELQKAHATLHNDSAMAAKAQRKINSLEAREFKSLLSDYMREKFCGRMDLPNLGIDGLITRSEKVVIRRSMEGKIGPGQILKRMAKSTQKIKTKESRKNRPH